MKAGYEAINFKDIPHITAREAAFKKGKRNASTYTQEQLLEMLKGRNFEEVYEAFGAISKLKIKKNLPILKNIALYDEDIETQEDAILTIRQIGGRNAMDILRFLKTTEHKEFIEEVLQRNL